MNKKIKIIIICFSCVLAIYLLLIAIFSIINKGNLKGENNDLKEISTKIESNQTNNINIQQNSVSGVELNKRYSSIFSPKFGNKDAKVSVVMFIDFDCHFCKQEYQFLRSIMKKYKDSGYFEFRNMPLTTLHPNAEILANAAMCANAQGKFWEMSDEIFENYDSRQSIEDEVEFMHAMYNYGKNIGLNMNDFSVCYDKNSFQSVVNKDYVDGVDYGVNGTPTFFVNGNKVEGVVSYDNWDKLFQLSLEKKQ